MLATIPFEFLIWTIVIFTILGIGMGAIAASYFWPTGKSVVFADPIPAASPLSETETANFQQGCDAFKAGKYRSAIDRFSKVIERSPTCAAAYHNRGLTFANLGDDNTAIRNLLEAGEFYDQQGQKEALDRLKRDLESLRAQRQGQTAQSGKTS
ncbi:MAG: hypothetical protein F6K19_36825 [Cyanothece sp. SIO1E1]|nr:hypothetical protein [Cyanothece sp. SIO1E1]